MDTFLTFSVCENEIIKADLTTEKFVHIDFVSVERAEENL